jgi:hypothetical protein
MIKLSLKNAPSLISLLIFSSSLFFKAFKVIELKEIKDYHSLELLLVEAFSTEVRPSEGAFTLTIIWNLIKDFTPPYFLKQRLSGRIIIS